MKLAMVMAMFRNFSVKLFAIFTSSGENCSFCVKIPIFKESLMRFFTNFSATFLSFVCNVGIH